MKKSNLIGIDLAKNVLQVVKVSKHGELLTNKAVSPSKLKQLLAKSAPSIVVMEHVEAVTTGAGLRSRLATKSE